MLTQGNFVHLTDVNSLDESMTWSTEADMARPPRTVSSAWRREVASNGGRGEAPCALCFRDGDCEAASERSGFGGSTLSDGGYCCSGTTALGPAWRWSVRCRAVYFLCFLLRLWTASWRRLQVQEKVICRTGLDLSGQRLYSGVALTVLMPQSNRSESLEVCFRFSPCLCPNLTG